MSNMANATAGRFQQAPPGGGPRQPQYQAYPGAGGQYYQAGSQQHQQQFNAFQRYYAQGPAAPVGYGAPPGVQQPRPPPPPPGETSAPGTTTQFTQSTYGSATASNGSFVPPLLPPPLPPMFPWMSPALAESMTSSQYGQSFREEASQLPFVPIIVNDSDLAKMTENVIKEAEQVDNEQLQYYKDVLNQDLPQALKDMFQPLYCKLCILTLSSPIVAKDHYNGKRHKKSMEVWFSKNPHLLITQKKPPVAAVRAMPTNNEIHSNNNSAPPENSGLISGFIRKHFPDRANNLPGSSPRVSQPQPLIKPSPPTTAPPQNDRKNTQQMQQQQHQLQFDKKPLPSPAKPMPAVATPPPPITSKTEQNSNGNSDNQAIPNQPVKRNENWQNSQSNSNSSGSINNSNSLPPLKRPKLEGPPGPPVQLQQTLFAGDKKTIEELNTYHPGQKLCQVCNVQLSSQVQADQHFKGKNHAAKLAALLEGGTAGGTEPIAGPSSSLLNQNQILPQPISPGEGFVARNPNLNKASVVNENNQERSNPFSPRGGGAGGGRGGTGGRGGGGGGPPRFNNNLSHNNRGRGNNRNNRFNNGPRFR